MSYDEDLNPVLEKATTEELGYLHDTIKSKFFSEWLSTHERYRVGYPDHSQYPDLIADEIRAFGGNTFRNLVRGEGPAYYEVVCDVAEKVRANFGRESPVELVEQAIMARILDKAWGKMTEEEKLAILAEIGQANVSALGGGSAMAFQALFKAGGFASYKLMLIVVNAVAKQALGRGLAFAANTALTRTMGVVVGPIGWAVTALLTLVQIAGPSFKVTIPCVVLVGWLRTQQRTRKCDACGAMISDASFGFCPQCGEELPRRTEGEAES